jgi:hypothetical protein
MARVTENWVGFLGQKPRLVIKLKKPLAANLRYLGSPEVNSVATASIEAFERVER